MPTWLILTIAALVLLAGATLPVLAGVRRRRAERFTAAIRVSRARLDALGYQLDSDGSGADVTEVQRLRGLAEATLAAADDERSAVTCGEADELTERAERELTRARDAASAPSPAPPPEGDR